MADKTSQRTKAQIEQELAAARARLSGNVQDLISEVHPKAVAQRSVADAKQMANDEFTNLKTQFKDADTGEWRTDRLTAIGTAALGVLTFLGVARGIVRKVKGH